MFCQKYRKIISRKLDGKLSPQEEKKLSSHLASCFRCRYYLKKLEMIQTTALSIPSPEPSPEYWKQSAARIKHRLTEEQVKSQYREKRKRSSFWLARWVWVLPTLIAIGAIFWPIFSSKIKPKESETYPFSSEEIWPFLDEASETDSFSLEAFNSLIEEAILDLSYDDIHDYSLVDNHLLEIEDLTEEEMDILLKEMRKSSLGKGS